MHFFRGVRWAFLAVATLVNLSVGAVIVWVTFFSGHHLPFFRSAKAGPIVVEYKDFVSILLTAIGVMIALGSLILAIVAVIGYAEGRKMVEGRIDQEVKRRVAAMLPRLLMDQGAYTGSAEDAQRIAMASDDDGT